MTSCLLTKSPDRLVAVADGRLSVTSKGVLTTSLDSAQKIVVFPTRYEIPVVSVGRFSHFSEYTGPTWHVAYAGTRALVSEILDGFRSRVCGNLRLSRGKNGVPTFDEHFDRSRSYDDSYNFDNDELPKLEPWELIHEFRKVAEAKSTEWAQNRAFPDCEFLLFGKELQTRRYVAHKAIPRKLGWHTGSPVEFDFHLIKDGELAAIGSPDVSKRAYADAELVRGISGWSKAADAFGDGSIFADFDLDGDLNTKPTSKAPALPQPNPADWGSTKVEERLIDHVLGAGDAGVGGKLTIATGGWYGEIQIEKR